MLSDTYNSPSRCPQHQRIPFENASRSNEILYRTDEWRRLKKYILKRDGAICCQCNATENLHIDHIIPPRGDVLLFFDKGNLQILCSSCHRSKTGREIGSRK